MNYGLLIAGFALLINPVITTYDVIPDAVGFVLILAGLTRMSYFIDRIRDARKFFSYLAYAELGKIAVSVMLLLTGSVITGSDKVMWTFVFSLLEACLFVPATLWLFEGISFSSVSYGGSAESESTVGKKGKKTERATKVRNGTIFFYVFRCVATLVPELTELEMYDNLGNVERTSRPLTYYKNFLYVVFSIAVLVLGIVFLVKTARFFSSMKKDAAYNARFAEVYCEAQVTRSSFFLSVNMKNGLLLFVISVFTSFMLILDSVNLMVGTVSALFLIASVLVVRKNAPAMKAVLPFAVLRGLCAIAAFWLQIRYFDEYAVEAVEWVEKASARYYLMAGVIALENALALASFLAYAVLWMKSLKRQIPLCGVMAESVQYSKKEKDRETAQAARRKLIGFGIFATLALVSASLYRFLALTTEMFIVVYAVLAIAWIADTVYAVASINTLVYDKEIG